MVSQAIIIVFSILYCTNALRMNKGQQPDSKQIDLDRERSNYDLIVRSINARFMIGQPNSDMKKAGVVLHGIDGIDTDLKKRNDDFEFLVNGTGLTNLSFAASIINSRMPYPFAGWTDHPERKRLASAGFVLSPTAVAGSLRCAYDNDGVSNAIQCKKDNPDCVPGCVGRWRFRGVVESRSWCNPDIMNQSSSCAWEPSAIDTMMKRHETRVNAFLKNNSGNCRIATWPKCPIHNEIVLDPVKLRDYLPGAIEGIYFMTGDAAFDDQHAERGKLEAGGIQKRFKQRFGQAIPIMQISKWNMPNPFELA